ncbi:MAG: cbb3-type cytochrome c oxidase subunit II [Parachlamydiaceae bacterium]|nr:cbb3-type cytochrome c oxidase subunit II [Parachlamydiaceae bacterium]
MNQPPNNPEKPQNEQKKEIKNVHGSFLHNIDRSAILTIIGVILLFSSSIIVTLIAPRYIDTTWTSPSSPFQVQMYEIEDPNLYISSVATGGKNLQYVHHLKQDFSLLAFKEDENLRIIAPKELEHYITRFGENELKLTSRLLVLREPSIALKKDVENLRSELEKKWDKRQEDADKKGPEKITYEILELYDPNQRELFSFDPSGGIIPNWVDKNYKILDTPYKQPYHHDNGVIYILNPTEFKISPFKFGDQERWRYDKDGRPVKDVEELKSPALGFYSRKELIEMGEKIYAIEGCWYCHTDQTRTLIQDTVLNGSDSYPAPPSSANEYIYQKITFPGTRRIGPDISRVGVKKPSRDWHESHFWSPTSASKGSIMPAFQHFFDHDPRGTSKNQIGVPNYQFEAIYQYMMTKGTRITPPTQAWWLGQDPVNTMEIITGNKKK